MNELVFVCQLSYLYNCTFGPLPPFLVFRFMLCLPPLLYVASFLLSIHVIEPSNGTSLNPKLIMMASFNPGLPADPTARCSIQRSSQAPRMTSQALNSLASLITHRFP